MPMRLSRAGATVDGHQSSYNFEQWVNGDGGQDSESHDDDNSEVLAEDKEYMKAHRKPSASRALRL